MGARYRDARPREHGGSGALNARLSEILLLRRMTQHLSRQQALLQLPIAAPPAELADAKVEVLEAGSGLPAEEDDDLMSDVDDEAAPLPVPSVAPEFRVVAPATVPGVVTRKRKAMATQAKPKPVKTPKSAQEHTDLLRRAWASRRA